MFSKLSHLMSQSLLRYMSSLHHLPVENSVLLVCFFVRVLLLTLYDTYRLHTSLLGMRLGYLFLLFGVRARVFFLERYQEFWVCFHHYRVSWVLSFFICLWVRSRFIMRYPIPMTIIGRTVTDKSLSISSIILELLHQIQEEYFA